MATPDPLQTARLQMVAEQLEHRGIHDANVLAAMGKVRRDVFVPKEQQANAYRDGALALDHGQTISQPYIVALMTQALELTGNETVLEIGTGSGYQCAVLCELARWVTSVERHEELSNQAAAALKTLGYTNYTLVVGDGTYGWRELAPYDRIMVTAAAQRMPQALFDQLREGGILVIPLGPTEDQALQAIKRINGQPSLRELSPCRFVPLVGSEEPRW
ncbi:MAG TPA: protein-L-isoaspartate(D-aspartate) O-methyltransferase [Pirellulales bacterium]|jgi:protein-L-isoaspartate(D-aspartate) O-methyltransferase|nr:protein-L-isoaspartate(D-aspartate) O-methyltransferase [Pirellulales bacterium]